MIEVKRKILYLAAVFLAVAMLTLSISNASATKPASITDQELTLLLGGWPSPYMSSRPLGESGGMIVYWTDLPVAFSGTISGLGVYNGETLLKVDGTALGHAIITLTNAVIEGKTGDLTMTWCQGGWTITSSTDELEGLRGTGTAMIDESIPVLYHLTGQIHFDPK